MKKLQIAVIGSAGPEEYMYDKPIKRMYEAAEQLGRSIAEKDCLLVTGGKGGIMESACRGAKDKNGITIGEIAGNGRNTGNKFVDIEIVTQDIGFRGPSLLIGMSDAVISLGGGAGTLQEIAVAYRMKRPIVLLVGYGGWTDRLKELAYLDERRLVPFLVASSPDEAVVRALSLARKERSLWTK